MSLRPTAIVLAAGRGTRFLASGGEIYKQIVPYQGEPVIARLVRQIQDTGLFGPTIVVLGDDPDCRASIRDVLSKFDVEFLINEDSTRDNNLLSFLVAIEAVESPVVLIEADCIVSSTDLSVMAQDISPSEVRWANIGDVSQYEYGGLVEVDPSTGRGIYIDVLDRKRFSEFKNAGRFGVKMFGLTSFGDQALSTFRSQANTLQDKYEKYFYAKTFTHFSSRF